MNGGRVDGNDIRSEIWAGHVRPLGLDKDITEFHTECGGKPQRALNPGVIWSDLPFKKVTLAAL